MYLTPMSCHIPVHCHRSMCVHHTNCYDSPWTGLLTLGDGNCHRWTAVGVRVTPLERYNNNRTIWEQSCQALDMDTQQMDAQHMLPD